jgi:phospholipase/carboxylesterase
MISQLLPGAQFAYRIRPASVSPPKGCLLLLHGVGGNERNFSEISKWIDPAILVIMPQGPIALSNSGDQFAWFHVAFTQDGPQINEQEADESRLRLLVFIKEMQALYQVTSGNTVVASFSQGGIMSASVALTFPGEVKGFAVLSGRILPEIKPHINKLEGFKQLQAYLAHGKFDSKLPISFLFQADELLNDLNVPHITKIYPMDHEISEDELRDFVQWLNEQFELTTSNF